MFLCVHAIKFPLVVMITLTEFHSTPRFKVHHMKSRSSATHRTEIAKKKVNSMNL